jgi:MFS family permease
VLGVVFLAMGLVGASMLRNPPAGYRVPGWSPPGDRVAISRREIPTLEMLRTPTFYVLWLAYCFGATAGLMTISQLVPFARNAGLGIGAAALAITVGAVGNAGGRILSGWLSDAVGRLATLRAMVAISAAAMPALYLWREQAVMFYVLVGIVYWCYGTQLSVFASTTADFYGTKNLGLNYGVLFTAWGVAGIVGPIAAGRAYDASGDYRSAFFVAGALAVAAFAILTFARVPSVEARKTAEDGTSDIEQPHVEKRRTREELQPVKK